MKIKHMLLMIFDLIDKKVNKIIKKDS